MFAATDIGFARGGRQIVRPCSLELRPGEVTVVIGPNGAGKSSLMKLLCGEIRPDQGRVTHCGNDIADMAPLELARCRAVLPQSTVLSFSFSVLEVVRMGALAHGARDPRRAAEVALERVGLLDRQAMPYQRLSGGQQQRVQFARVLAQVPQAVEDGMPKALFLDEPTSSLDITHQISVLETAKDFARAGGVVLAVLHDLNLAAEFADRLIVMREGEVFASGTVGETLSEAMVRQVYGIAGAVGRLPVDPVPYVLTQSRKRAG